MKFIVHTCAKILKSSVHEDYESKELALIPGGGGENTTPKLPLKDGGY